jgi:hypothetical protein
VIAERKGKVVFPVAIDPITIYRHYDQQASLARTRLLVK